MKKIRSQALNIVQEFLAAGYDLRRNLISGKSSSARVAPNISECSPAMN